MPPIRPSPRRMEEGDRFGVGKIGDFVSGQKNCGQFMGSASINATGHVPTDIFWFENLGAYVGFYLAGYRPVESFQAATLC